MLVAPSFLSADFLNLEKEVRMCNETADLIHLDIMDGTFVPNISFGFPVCKAISKAARKPMDAHLMVVKPQNWLETLAGMGVEMVSFHLEATGRSTSAVIEKIHELGMKAGVAIDPDVPVEKLYIFIGKADYFTIMSVFAGFGGQKFIYETLDKVATLRAELDRRGAKALIEVDGGVGLDNVKAIAEAGADIVVAGSSVFNASEPRTAVLALREA